jgi:hypothetical protein
VMICKVHWQMQAEKCLESRHVSEWTADEFIRWCAKKRPLQNRYLARSVAVKHEDGGKGNLKYVARMAAILTSASAYSRSCYQQLYQIPLLPDCRVQIIFCGASDSTRS